MEIKDELRKTYSVGQSAVTTLIKYSSIVTSTIFFMKKDEEGVSSDT